jgi:RNA polymerase sigma-70 factor (ECF subfamily)
MSVALPLTGSLAVPNQVTPRDELTALMTRYEAPLCGYLRVILHDEDAVFDCAQDTFLRAYEHLERGKSVNSQWIYKVARNRAIDQIRRKTKMATYNEVLNDLPAPVTAISDRDRRVRTALDLIEPTDRELLHLAIIDRFRTDDIAAMLGIRAGAVRVRLFRARERFRAVYGETQ